MSHVSRRLGALVAVSALSLTGVTLVAAPAQAVPDTRSVDQAATWLAGQLTDGLMYNPAFGGFNDYGLSIDAGLALDAVDKQPAAVTAIGKAIRAHYYSYTTGDDFGGPEVYAGGQAKALVMAQVAGTGPASYPASIQTQLEDRVAIASPNTGRIQNSGETDFNPPFDPVDSANVFGQAFAARALTVAGSDLADEAVTFLLQQQCTDGHFRQSFSPKDALDQSCDAGAPGTTGDALGATATAVIQLDATPALAADPAVTAALTDAVTWLKTQQAGDGSFNNGNSNTTGLAGWALGDRGETAAATAAATWLRDRQADDTDACTKLKPHVGAIAFDDAALAEGRSNGITDNTVGQWQRATSQTLVGLRSLEAESAAVLNVTGPGGYVQARKAANYSITGAAAGSKLCLTVASNSRAATAGVAGTASAALTMPAGTANRTVKVTDRNGNTDTVVTKVLGAKTLTVTPALRRVPRGSAVRVTVSGLAAGESVRLRYRGVLVASGTATATGTFVRKVRVGRTLGLATIAATGQFPAIRKGATTIRVIR